MLKEFRDFILRDRLIDLAVAVVVGAAFGTLVMAMVRDLMTPLIAALGGKPDFSDLAFRINDSRFAYGDLINALISFLIIAAAVFFLVVHPLGKVKQRVERTKRECPHCLSEIPEAARRCAFCTSEVEPLTSELERSPRIFRSRQRSSGA
jgi:large conductance mechanosensitive channel